MKVLHYIPTIDRSSGGLGGYMKLLSKDLGKICELHIATHRSEHPLEIENCTIHYIADWKNPLKMRIEWNSLLDNICPNIIHCNGCWNPGSSLVQKWSQKRDFKVVLSPHGMLEPWIIRRHYYTRKLPALGLYQKAAVKNADLIHATAQSEKEHLLDLGWNNNIAIVPNGVDISTIRVKSSWTRKGNILFLSRVHPKKGVDFLIDALSNIKNDYKCIIAGEGEDSYVEGLKKKSIELGISDKITFIGGVYGEQKWQLYRDADVFVMPTFSENFGIVVAEALASGTPVITTKGAPWKELETRHCGWWIDVGVAPLLSALKSYFNSSDKELENMGRNGRNLIEEKYSTVSEAEEMVRMYKKLLD